MRYNLESTLPINAFSPRGGRGPFNHGMTLEGGGGGGGALGGITKGLGSIAKGLTGAVKGIVQPVYNATLKNIPGVDNALVGLDKAVGKSIPGGWGTVAAVASSFIPGSQLALMSNGLLTSQGLATGLGALSGSGVMRGNHEFNLQGAIMGGAMAYGSAELSQAFQNAGSELANASTTASTDAMANAAKSASTTGGDAISNFNSSQMLTGPDAALASTPAFDPSSATNFSYTPSGEMVPSNISPNITGATPFTPPVSTPSGLETLTAAGKGTMSNMADAGAGVKNLLGFGADGSAAAARSAFTGAASPITQGGLTAGFMGTTGMMALEEQQKALDAQKASGNIGQAEYDAAKAKIDAQIATARETVAANPLRSDVGTGSFRDETPTTYANNPDTLYENNSAPVYAAGGQVTLPPDDQTNMASQSPIDFLGQYKQQTQQLQPTGLQALSQNTGTGSTPQNYYGGGAGLGSMSGSSGALPLEGQYGIVKMAGGGMLPPRFLSGGGDGMSDSIKANIGGTQEARLADGEFVIPADVVSHLGNGSSKAGAKQLYSMMDKVRTARTGRKSQGKQINPRKYLSA
jgi:hypothetical protein